MYLRVYAYECVECVLVCCVCVVCICYGMFVVICGALHVGAINVCVPKNIATKSIVNSSIDSRYHNYKRYFRAERLSQVLAQNLNVPIYT